MRNETCIIDNMKKEMIAMWVVLITEILFAAIELTGSQSAQFSWMNYAVYFAVAIAIIFGSSYFFGKRKNSKSIK